MGRLTRCGSLAWVISSKKRRASRLGRTLNHGLLKLGVWGPSEQVSRSQYIRRTYGSFDLAASVAKTNISHGPGARTFDLTGCGKSRTTHHRRRILGGANHNILWPP